MILALILASALDIHSSCMKIGTYYYEYNPIIPNSCSGQVLVGAATTAGFSIFYSKTKHKKEMRIIMTILIGAHIAAAIHNYKHD